MHDGSCWVARRPDAAAAAQLLVAPGGDPAVIELVKPFLQAHGRLLPTLDTPEKVSAPAQQLDAGAMTMYYIHDGSLCRAQPAGVFQSKGFLFELLPSLAESCRSIVSAVQSQSLMLCMYY